MRAEGSSLNKNFSEVKVDKMPIEIDDKTADMLEGKLKRALADLIGERLKEAVADLEEAMATRGYENIDEHILAAQEKINEVIKAAETETE